MANDPEVLIIPTLGSLWVHRDDLSPNFPVMQIRVVGKGMLSKDRRKKKTIEECVVYQNTSGGSGRLFCRSVREFLSIYLPYKEQKGGVQEQT